RKRKKTRKAAWKEARNGFAPEPISIYAHEAEPCRIYRSPHHGAAGILDAMHHHGFVERGFFAQPL
ncbi:hypothetical protein ACQV5M_20930, partial [Leptospira sp. SA-E8]|uniref:hypothetical protein n=1 Tax=Leptospira sp. SA-E8 TaxID=3422259 RepID=UPI003EBDDBA7